VSLTYRILDASEWDRLLPFLDSNFLPSPESSSAAIAEDEDGNIVGILFLQVVLHMEPLILTSPKVNFARLHDTLYNALGDRKGLKFYCFSDKDIIDGMVEHLGMKLLPYRVYEQEIA